MCCDRGSTASATLGSWEDWRTADWTILVATRGWLIEFRSTNLPHSQGLAWTMDPHRWRQVRGLRWSSGERVEPPGTEPMAHLLIDLPSFDASSDGVVGEALVAFGQLAEKRAGGREVDPVGTLS